MTGALPLVEAAILYAVLFFPAFALAPDSFPVSEMLNFSVGAELMRVVCYEGPAFLLVWYLYRGRNELLYLRYTGTPLTIRRAASGLLKCRPRKSDIKPCILTFLAVCAGGYAVSLLSLLAPAEWSLIGVTPPELTNSDTLSLSPGVIAVIVLSSLVTGYMEELFFRVYLNERLKSVHLGAARVMLVASLLFAACHLYEGVFGIVNAFIAGFILATARFHGARLNALALAHAGWNTAVWLSMYLPV